MFSTLRISLVIALVSLSIGIATPAYAIDLAAAKQQGLVGEQMNGYVGVVQRAAGVEALVNNINVQRRKLYQDVARQNGVPLSSVEQLAGEKAINQASPGTMVQDANGNWIRR